MARELGISTDEFQEALVKISNSTVVALDELWAVSDASGDQVSLLDTLQDHDAPDPQQLLDASELKDRLADAISALPEQMHLIFQLNPMTFLIEQTRGILIWKQHVQWVHWLLQTLASTVFAWIGYAWFQKTRKGFADVL